MLKIIAFLKNKKKLNRLMDHPFFLALVAQQARKYS